jgi:hypothetical protein|tara:strand:- start:300 stop:473 length:174 start_codon:yes stop_codon:yes gene_type:complete
MFWKKNNNDYVLKLKQDRNLRWIVESLRVPANSEEELIQKVKDITTEILNHLKELNS